MVIYVLSLRHITVFNKDSMSKSVLNNFLRDRRKRMGMSQKDMSKALGMSVRSYQRFESGDWRALFLYCECMRVLDLSVVVVPRENIL